MSNLEVCFAVGGAFVGGVSTLAIFVKAIGWAISKELKPFVERLERLENDNQTAIKKEDSHYILILEKLNEIKDELNTKVTWEEIKEQQDSCPAREWVKNEMSNAITIRRQDA